MHQPIQWRRLGDPTWTPGTLVDGFDGLYAIRLTTGPDTYVTMDRNGQTRSAPTLGPWEGRWQLSTTTPTLRITPAVVTYVVEIRET